MMVVQPCTLLFHMAMYVKWESYLMSHSTGIAVFPFVKCRHLCYKKVKLISCILTTNKTVSFNHFSAQYMFCTVSMLYKIGEQLFLIFTFV